MTKTPLILYTIFFSESLRHFRIYIENDVARAETSIILLLLFILAIIIFLINIILLL